MRIWKELLKEMKERKVKGETGLIRVCDLSRIRKKN